MNKKSLFSQYLSLKISLALLIVLMCFVFLLPLGIVKADSDTSSSTTTSTECDTEVKERGIFTEGLANKCLNCGDCTKCDILRVASNIFNFIVKIVGGLAILMLVLSGILYITSAGRAEALKEAKAALVATIVGFIIVLTSWIIINLVMTTLKYEGYQGGKWYAPVDCQGT